MRKLLFILFVLICSASHAQKKTIEGKWKLISFSQIEESYNSANVIDTFEIQTDSTAASQLGEFLYIFSNDKKFQLKQNGTLSSHGTYTVNYDSSKIVLSKPDSGIVKGHKEQMQFHLRENYLVLIVPENSSTLKLKLKRVD